MHFASSQQATNNASRAIGSGTTNRGGVTGSLNRFLNGAYGAEINGSNSTNHVNNGRENQRLGGGFLRGFANISGFLNLNNRRNRSQSMSAVDENLNPVLLHDMTSFT